MRVVRKAASLLVGIALIGASAANAQIGGIVFDPDAFKRQLEQLNAARDQIAAAKSQIDEAKRLYQSVNEATDISNIANRLKTDALRTSNVSSTSLDGYMNGNLDVVGGLRGTP